jgi:hypothetical protein
MAAWSSDGKRRVFESRRARVPLVWPEYRGEARYNALSYARTLSVLIGLC